MLSLLYIIKCTWSHTTHQEYGRLLVFSSGTEELVNKDLMANGMNGRMNEEAEL